MGILWKGSAPDRESIALTESRRFLGATKTTEKDKIHFEVDVPNNILDLRVGLSHMVLVFMSCVKNTPQETALGVYCTAK